MSEILKSLKLLKNTINSECRGNHNYDFFLDMVLNDLVKNRLFMIDTSLQIYGGFIVNYILDIDIFNSKHNIDVIINENFAHNRFLLFDRLYWLFNMFYIFSDKIHYNVLFKTDYPQLIETRRNKKKVRGAFTYNFNEKNICLDFTCLLNCKPKGIFGEEPDFNVNSLIIDNTGSICVRNSRTNLSSIINSLKTKKIIPIYNYAFTEEEYNIYIKNVYENCPNFINKCLNLAYREFKMREKGFQVINGLTQQEYNNATCPICLDNNSRSSKFITLICGHSVHLNCCYNYIVRGDGINRYKCSVCRKWIVLRNNNPNQKCITLDRETLNFYTTLIQSRSEETASTISSTISHII